jgi:hypothetical protein
MLTIQNYKLGEGCIFKGWELECVAEFDEHYRFLWIDVGYKRRKKYEVALDREPEGLGHQMNVIDVDDSKIINEWTIPYWEIEEHWKFIEKSIELMEQTKV